MKYKRRFLWGNIGVLLLFALAGIDCDGPPEQGGSPATPVPTTAPPASVAPVTTQVPLVAYSVASPTLPYLVGPDTPCQEWLPTALSVGWEADREVIETLLSIMWRESRCRPEALNGSDPNGGSVGLLQINNFWCKPNRYTDRGWLQDQGVLTDCSELHNPATNLRAGLIIYLYSLGKNQNGWHPWRL